MQRLSTQIDLDGAGWWWQLNDALLPADYLPTMQQLAITQEWAQSWTPTLGSLFSLSVADRRGTGHLQASHRLR